MAQSNTDNIRFTQSDSVDKMSNQNQSKSTADEPTEFEDTSPSETDYPSPTREESDEHKQPPSDLRSLVLIADALDEFFVAFQDTFTEYDDLEPREAFAKYMASKHGIEFSEPTSDFGADNEAPGNLGLITGGRGGGFCAVSDLAIDYNNNLVTGGVDNRRGWFLQSRGLRDPVLRLFDTENVGDDFRKEAPDDAHQFVEAMLESFDHTGDGGSGNDVIQGLQNLFEDPERLAWALEAVTVGDRSVIEVSAILGGGTGTSVAVLCDELARIGLINRDNTSLGFDLGIQQARVNNDVHLGQFDDGSDRYTWHDALAAAARIGQRIRNGDVDWARWSENIMLTYNYWALNNNPDFQQLQNFTWELRNDADPETVERLVNNEPRFSNLGHTERDRMKCLSTFAHRQLLRRPARAQFWVGEEDYDPSDCETDYHGCAWTSGFDGIHDYSELEDRNIPGLEGVDGHRDALHGLGYTASAMLNSTVAHHEIHRANVVVQAAGIDLWEGDLQIVENAVEDVLDLGFSSDNEREQPVRAIAMNGLGTEDFPGGYPLAVSVYAGHDLLLEAHERMATPAYKRAVNGGDN